MLTKIEIEYMEAIKTIAREMRKANADQPNNELDWEQRFYEVARDLYVKAVTNNHNSVECGGVAKTVIYQAKVFIQILKDA